MVMTDSAGVTIVRSTSSTDSPALFVSNPVLTLGGKDTPEESFYRVTSANVGTDDNGNMYVLDADAYQVQVFDSIGRHLRTLGGQGGGPGELQFPFALAVGEDGRTSRHDLTQSLSPKGRGLDRLTRRSHTRASSDQELLDPASRRG